MAITKKYMISYNYTDVLFLQRNTTINNAKEETPWSGLNKENDVGFYSMFDISPDIFIQTYKQTVSFYD